MPRRLVNFLRRRYRRLGIDVVKFPGNGSLPFVLNHCRIDTVLDVGANIGQTGIFLRGMNFDGRIISFEPLTDAYSALSRACAKDSQWTSHPLALGATNEEKVIRVSSNTVYSSFLPTDRFAEKVDTVSQQVRSETVKVKRLDDLWPELHLDGQKVLLKVDTQGYEKNVLDGAAGVLDKIVALQLEMSIHPLYVGQPSYMEVMEYVQSRGFLIAGMVPNWNDPNTGELLEFDGIFVRNQGGNLGPIQSPRANGAVESAVGV
jgi:FkbM family methyltransferase